MFLVVVVVVVVVVNERLSKRVLYPLSESLLCNGVVYSDGNALFRYNTVRFLH